MLQVQGTNPLYQWFKDDKKLSDGHKYKGSTTPELTIIGSGQQVKGMYLCLVKNMYEEIQSRETDYGKFVFQVRINESDSI